MLRNWRRGPELREKVGAGKNRSPNFLVDGLGIHLYITWRYSLGTLVPLWRTRRGNARLDREPRQCIFKETISAEIDRAQEEQPTWLLDLARTTHYHQFKHWGQTLGEIDVVLDNSARWCTGPTEHQ